jgi:hypothetical protein
VKYLYVKHKNISLIYFLIPNHARPQKMRSLAGKLPENTTLFARRPFRSPHHIISDVALVGGGLPQSGEISLAHNVDSILNDKLSSDNSNGVEQPELILEN